MKNSKLKNPGTDLPSAFVRVASVALFVSVLSVSSVVQAAPIDLLRNTTDGLTVFHDDFESYTVTSSPLVTPSSANATGTWSSSTVFGGNGAAPEIGITNQAGSLDNVVPQEGSQFFQMSSVTPTVPAAQTWQGHGIVGNSTNTKTIEANVAFNLATGSNEFFIYLYGGAANADFIGAFAFIGTTGTRGVSNTLMDANSGSWQQTQTPLSANLTFDSDDGIGANEWNTFKVVYVNGTSSLDVSINGGPVATIGTASGITSTLNSLSFNQTANTNVYFDAVIPEPSSIILMGLGVLSMVVIGRNRKARR